MESRDLDKIATAVVDGAKLAFADLNNQVQEACNHFARGEQAKGLEKLMNAALDFARWEDTAYRLINGKNKRPKFSTQCRKKLLDRSVHIVTSDEARSVVLNKVYGDKLHLKGKVIKEYTLVDAAELVAEVFEIKGIDPVGAVMQSLKRYRKSISGLALIYFDESTDRFRAIDATKALLPDLPSSPGRPKK